MAGAASTDGSRRGALVVLWGLVTAGLAAAGGIGLGMVLRLAGGGSTAPPAPVVLGPPDLTPGQVRSRGRVALVRDAKGYLALSLVCPHLGCAPAWHDGKKRFLCPCHGSSFTLEGGLIQGPARRGLTHLALSQDQEGRLVANPAKNVGRDFRLEPKAGA